MIAPLTAPVPWRAHPARGEEGMAHLIDANGNTVAIGPEGEDALLYARVAEFVCEAVNDADNAETPYLGALLGLHGRTAEDEDSRYDE